MSLAEKDGRTDGVKKVGFGVKVVLRGEAGGRPEGL